MPPARRLREAETRVIGGIADQHLRQRRGGIDGAEGGRHQRLAVPFALMRGQHRYRPHHYQRMRASLRIGERDWPKLDRADQILLVIECREAEGGQEIGALANAIGGALTPLGFEGGVEQSVHEVRWD